MPILPIDLLDVSIYLYPTEEAARAGERAGGSGFLVRVDIDDPFWKNVGTTYAVTNSHVVRGGATFLRVNTHEDRFDVVSVPPDSWVHHADGDDVAVAPITISDRTYRLKAVDPKSFVKREDVHWYAVGSDTAMVGRFINHEGKQRNTPTVRFGHVSMLPWEPIQPEGGRLPQESFLVEEHSISGYSGSPVFVYHLFPEKTVELADFDPETIEKPPFVFGLIIRLLGINWGHLRDKAPVRDPGGELAGDKTHVRFGTGMGTVVPAWKLHELLFDDPEVVQMREEAEREWREQHSEDESAATLEDGGERP